MGNAEKPKVDINEQRAKMMPKNYQLALKTRLNDGRLAVEGSNDQYAAPGLQPFMLCTGKGELYIQVELLEKNDTKRKMAFPWRLGSYVRKGDGAAWERVQVTPDGDDPYFEGGMLELAPGKILMADTYITPDEADENYGWGEFWETTDGFKTFKLASRPHFHLPNYNYYASTDDGGNPYCAARLHRSIVPMPDGSLLMPLYGCMKGDVASSAYMPTMKKSRVMVVRSQDGGQNWELLSTVAADAGIGTEGFGEPTLLRVGQGPHTGRLWCVMRTGRDLYRNFSDDDGKTWDVYRPLQLPGLDPYDFKKWEASFQSVREDAPLTRLSIQGSFVDPELMQMQNGVVVLAFGLRISEKMCWDNPTDERNGNYLAFSLDGGETFTHIVQVTSGILTTHYMAACQKPDGRLAVAYDVGMWNVAGSHSRVVDIDVKLK